MDIDRMKRKPAAKLRLGQGERGVPRRKCFAFTHASRLIHGQTQPARRWRVGLVFKST